MSEQESRPDTDGDQAVTHCPGCLAVNPPEAAFCNKCGMPIGMIATLDPLQSICATGWAYRRAISGGRWPVAFWGMLLIFGPTAALTIIVLVCSPLFLSSNREVLFWMVSFLPAVLYVAILYRVTKAYIRHLKSKPGTDQEHDGQVAGLTKPQGRGNLAPFEVAEMSGTSPSEMAPDWTPADSSGIPEDMFPIDCAACGYDLTGLGESGFCPACGADFDRGERLLDLYGPEVFIEDPPVATPSPPEHPARSRKVNIAIFVTVLAVLATMFFPSLSSSELIEQDRWPFVALLWVAAVAFWVRALRPGQN